MASPETIPLEKLSHIREFLEKLDGIELFVASQEGLPVEVSEGVDKDKAEATAALAEDLLRASDSVAQNILGSKSLSRVSLRLGGNSLVVIREPGTTLVIQGASRVTDIVSEIIEKYLKGEKVECPHCGADLTLETTKCPRCGATIPFIAAQCPHCGADTRIKECPRCGKPVTNEGKKVVEIETIEQKPLLYVNTGVGAAMGALLGYAITTGIPGTIAGAALGAAALYGISYKLLKTRKIIST